MRKSSQSGITLVVSLIMLIVLTLLVVSAIRFGNINLRIANNAQSQAEGEAATQAAVEKTIELIKAYPKLDSVPAQPALQVSTGGSTYTVAVSKPVCNLSVNVPTTTLDPQKAEDRACFSGGNTDPIFGADGKPIPQPSECKDQNWEIQATLNPATAQGVSMTMAQGVSVRVGSEVQCP
jgi:competence protein ComGC